MILYELGRGLAYRRVRHAEMHWYTRTIPALATFVVVGAVLILPTQPPLLGGNGLFASSMAVVSTLPGFFLAGLAAVATFNGLNMDAEMPAPAPTLRVKVGGTFQPITLSRRQFLSYLFSYLVLLSFILCCGLLAFSAATPSIASLKAWVAALDRGEAIWQIIRAGGLTLVVSTAASIVVTTLHGMFFLTERIHQP